MDALKNISQKFNISTTQLVYVKKKSNGRIFTFQSTQTGKFYCYDHDFHVQEHYWIGRVLWLTLNQESG
jgi:hypothetical protein